MIGSFLLEAFGQVLPGYGLRLLVAFGYLQREIRRGSPRGTSGTGIHWALGCGALGLALAGFFYPQHISVEHLLYIGGFGLLLLLMGSRVMSEDSGDHAESATKNGRVRVLIFLAILAAMTRASPAWAPRTTVSHHLYAALTWAILAWLWITWHRARFFRKDGQ